MASGNWPIYLCLAVAAAAFLFLYGISDKVFSLFLRSSIPPREKRRILERLRREFGFWEQLDLVEIRILGAEFPSRCCGAALLRISPTFRLSEAEDGERARGVGPEIRVCRRCLKQETR